MRPPNCTGILPPTAARMLLMTASFLGLPATAPFRSTRCSLRAPSSSQCLATAAGSSENIVSLFMSPCCRRTQCPSLISIAGMISIVWFWLWREGETDVTESGLPGHEIGEQRKSGGLAFLRMELDSENIILCHRRGKGETVDAVPPHQFRIAGFDVIAVHEIIAVGVGDDPPQRVRLGLHHLIPAHVGHFELAAALV